MDRSAANSTTNLTTNQRQINPMEQSLKSFKIILAMMLLLDFLFLGLFIPTANRDFLAFDFFVVYGYIAILLCAFAGLLVSRKNLIFPIKVVWISSLVGVVAIMAISGIQFFSCSWLIYFNPDEDIEMRCSWTFMRTYMDATIYILILGIKICQTFIAQITTDLITKKVRLETFDVSRDHESDDEDMVVFEKVVSQTGKSSKSKVRDATAAIA